MCCNKLLEHGTCNTSIQRDILERILPSSVTSYVYTTLHRMPRHHIAMGTQEGLDCTDS